jgi:hypothetical protein
MLVVVPVALVCSAFDKDSVGLIRCSACKETAVVVWYRSMCEAQPGGVASPLYHFYVCPVNCLISFVNWSAS